MRIYQHWLEQTGIFSDDDVPKIADLLNLPASLFVKSPANGGGSKYIYSIDNKELVSISVPLSAEYKKVTIRGQYFDLYPTQSTKELTNFLFSRKGNCKRLDISFKETDSEDLLNYDEYKAMSKKEVYLDYLTGSSVSNKKRKEDKSDPNSTNRKGIPDIHDNHRWIQYGDSNSTSHAKLYECTDGFNKLEVTLRNPEQSKLILEAYDTSDMSDFNELSLKALVKTINFVTPSSKRAKRLVQIASFRQFLGGEVKAIKWSEHCPERQELLLLDSFDLWKSHLHTNLLRGIDRFQLDPYQIEGIALCDNIGETLTPPVYTVGRGGPEPWQLRF